MVHGEAPSRSVLLYIVVSWSRINRVLVQIRQLDGEAGEVASGQESQPTSRHMRWNLCALSEQQPL